MIVQGVSISEMLNQSVTVLTKPGVATFEQFEKRGGQREALTYVVAAAAVAGIAALLFGLLSGIVAAILGGVMAFLLPVIGFFVFSFLVYTIGRSQGGTGTQDEVFYTNSLYAAPILAVTGAVGAIPILGCLAAPVTLGLGIYQLYLGYLAARSSMNLDQNKAILTMVLAIVAQLVIGAIIISIFGAIAVALGVASGTISTSP
ncbi:MAG: hypothetical protein RLZZ387_2497 [Chloroflexota bacterium]|jgi:hypothetical protein